MEIFIIIFLPILNYGLPGSQTLRLKKKFPPSLLGLETSRPQFQTDSFFKGWPNAYNYKYGSTAAVHVPSLT